MEERANYLVANFVWKGEPRWLIKLKWPEKCYRGIFALIILSFCLNKCLSVTPMQWHSRSPSPSHTHTKYVYGVQTFCSSFRNNWNFFTNRQAHYLLAHYLESCASKPRFAKYIFGVRTLCSSFGNNWKFFTTRQAHYSLAHYVESCISKCRLASPFNIPEFKLNLNDLQRR